MPARLFTISASALLSRYETFWDVPVEIPVCPAEVRERDLAMVSGVLMHACLVLCRAGHSWPIFPLFNHNTADYRMSTMHCPHIVQVSAFCGVHLPVLVY